MKAIVLVGGLVAASAVAASFVYNGAQSESSVQASAGGAAGGGSKIVAMTAAQVVAEAKHTSPQAIFSAKVDTPEALQKIFDEKGSGWATENLTTPVSASRSSGNRSDCPGEEDDSPKHTLYVRYVTDYPDNDQDRATIVYSDVKVPVTGGSRGRFSFETPFITEKIIRDRYEWKRTYQIRYWQGVDQDWEKRMRAEQERLDAQFMEAQNDNPARAIAIARQMAAIQNSIKNQRVTAMNETVHDSIEVEAPSPAWSFKYNNDTGKGDALYRRDTDIDYSQHRDEIEQNADAILAALEPIKQFGESLTSGGARQILGHSCQVVRSERWDAEKCVAEIDGQRVTLWSRIDKAHRTAVYLDASPCVSLAQFRPPANIDFDEEW